LPARAQAEVATGDDVDAFVRPEVVDLARTGDESRRCQRFPAASKACFDGAESAVLAREEDPRRIRSHCRRPGASPTRRRRA
jgi:hypothetical protein